MKRSHAEEELREDSGPDFNPTSMLTAIKRLTQDKPFDMVSVGYPGPVVHNRILAEPHSLGTGWVKFNFEKALRKPVKIVNDALMQAVGSYKGGRMLFLGLGTGLGAAMVVENVAQPMELAHLPYKKGKTFEDYAGERGLQKDGKKKWRKHILEIIEHLSAALEPDSIVIGGGNATKLDYMLPKMQRRFKCKCICRRLCDLGEQRFDHLRLIKSWSALLCSDKALEVDTKRHLRP